MTNIKAGDSSEQREAEKWLVHALSKKIGVDLSKKKLSLKGGKKIEIDAYSENPPILCEVWAHIGRPKGAQPKKVMTDAFKLLFAKTLIPDNCKLILLFASHEAAETFEGNTGMAQCLDTYGIEIEVIELPTHLEAEVLKAQTRQYR